MNELKAPKIPPLIWQETFKVHSYEAGPSGFATPQSICRFLQEAASNHASVLGVSGESLASIGQMWVLSQMSLRMSEFPQWHESVDIETWPTKRTTALRAYRDFLLYDDTSRLIGKAGTMWLLIDIESRRPLKIPSFISPLTSAGHEPDVLTPPEKNLFDNPDFDVNAIQSKTFEVRGSDIDYNLHVNNVCYLEWSLELIDSRFRLENFITSLDVQFVKEAKFGTVVKAECAAIVGNESLFVHRILDEQNAPLALLRTNWKRKKTTF